MSSILNCTTLTTTCVIPLVNNENKTSSITNCTTSNTCIDGLYVCNINAELLNVYNSAGKNKTVCVCNNAGTTIDCFMFDSGITARSVSHLRNGVKNFNFKCNSDGTDLCYTSSCGICGTYFLVVSCGGKNCYLPVKRYQYSNGTTTQNGIGNSLFTNSGFNNTGRACKFALANATTGIMTSYTVAANNFNSNLTSLVYNDSQVNQTCDKIKYYVCWKTYSCNCARGHRVIISIKPVEYISCSAVNNEHHCICLFLNGTKAVDNTTNGVPSSTSVVGSGNYCYYTNRGCGYSFQRDITYTCCCTITGDVDKDKKFSITATRPADYIYGRTDQYITKNASFTVNYKNPLSGNEDWDLIESGSTCICV